MAVRPLILAADNTIVTLEPNVVVYDSPDIDATPLKTTINKETIHQVICDLPRWCGVRISVDVNGELVPMLGFVKVVDTSNRTTTIPVASAFDTFVRSMVAEIVPLVKEAVDGQ